MKRLVLALLFLWGFPLWAGPGLLVRNAERYYKPPLRRKLHGEENLPPAPPLSLANPYSEADLFALKEADYFTGYRGEPWDQEGPCTRYEAAFLLGGLLNEISQVHGRLIHEGRFGPPRLLLPRIPWGRDRVLAAMAQGILRPRGMPWLH